MNVRYIEDRIRRAKRLARTTQQALRGEPPGPDDVRTYDELAERLRLLRAWAGISYRELHRRVLRARRERGATSLPAFDTVHRHLQPGRRRVDTELVVDIASVLLDRGAGQTVRSRAEDWRHACQALASRVDDAAVVEVAGVLPDDLPEFAGRAAELKRLLSVRPGPVWLIHGMPGAGKTTLAVHAAHQLLARQRCSDVQLFVNLRGYDPQRPPADPMAVLEGLLRRLGVAGNQIHRMGLARRRSKLRELLAGKEALLVLDNAVDEEQVRPLLPDSPTCVVLVTSRRRFDGLPAVRPLPLDPFTSAEAAELLQRGVGPELVDADPLSAVDIARLVGHLPLALALVVSRINASPDWSLRDHLERLAERRTRLQLDDGVQVALASSYDALPPQCRRLLRFLALHPGQDFDAHAAASLTGAVTEAEVSATADRLADLHTRNLLVQRNRGRYELHDLVRVFAAVRSTDEDRPSDRQAAVRRLFEYYTHTSALAIRRYAPHERRRSLAALHVPGAQPPAAPALDDRSSALAWLETERVNLIAVALQSEPTTATILACAVFPYLYHGGHNGDAELLLTHAGRTAEPEPQAAVLVDLAVLGIRAGHHHQVVEHLHRALAACRAAGNLAVERSAETTLGRLYWQLGDYRTAAQHVRRSLDLARKHGDVCGQTQGLAALGLIAVRQGKHRAALSELEQALALARRYTDDPRLEMNALANLADLYSRLGRHQAAIERLRRALAIAGDVGSPPREAVVRAHLGAAYTRAGAPEDGLGQLRAALRIAREHGDQHTVVEVLNTIGEALRRLGRPGQAISCQRKALSAATRYGLRYEQARALDGLAHAAVTTGDSAAARTHWQQALARFRELGTPEAEEISQRLAQDATR